MIEIQDFDSTKIKIGAEGIEEIIQNVRTIIATPKGSVPLDRDFGVSWFFIDKPDKRAMAGFVSEIIRQVEKYEPRVRVLEVQWKESEAGDGKFLPVVRLEVLEENV